MPSDREVWRRIGFWGRMWARLPYRWPFRALKLYVGRKAGYLGEEASS